MAATGMEANGWAGGSGGAAGGALGMGPAVDLERHKNTQTRSRKQNAAEVDDH